MTDTNRLQELAACLRAHAAYCQHEVAELTEAAAALDELSRIKGAALPENLARIERLHHAELTRLGIENTTQPGKDADADRRTLLDAARAYLLNWTVAEESFTKLRQHSTEERDRLKGELAETTARAEKAEALNKLASCVYCGHVGPKENFPRHITECLEHPLGEVKDPQMYGIRFFDLVQQVRYYQQDALAIICRACNCEDELAHAQKEIERLNGEWLLTGQEKDRFENEYLCIREQVAEAERDKAALRQTVQTWLDKQGHDRCWYYPDLFREIAATLGLEPSKLPALPQLAEFQEGCRRYQQEEYRAAVPSEGEAEKAQPVCKSCNDTHRVWLEERGREINCNYCPVPCPKCGAGNGYCTKTPCPCDCHAAGAEILAAHREEEWRPGLPPEALRNAWPEWVLDCGYVYVFEGNMYRGTHWDLPAEEITDQTKILHTSKFRPHGKTWAEVEALAAHRDTKPHNVILSAEPHTKRIDWGDGEVECVRVTVDTEPEKMP